MSFWLHRVLEPAAPPWLALGWRDVARDRVPSVEDEIIVLRWDGDGEAPRPQGEDADV